MRLGQYKIDFRENPFCLHFFANSLQKGSDARTPPKDIVLNTFCIKENAN